MSAIADGKVVSILYTLRNDAGEILDQSDHDPLMYLHGGGNIVPGLESALTGRAVGDRLNVKVPPVDGYGERDPSGVQKVQRDRFPPGVAIEVGMQFSAGGHPITVTAVDAGVVTVDFNHPLAGENLNFEVQVVGLRDATAEEMAHGHPHGPDGHGHHH